MTRKKWALSLVTCALLAGCAPDGAPLRPRPDQKLRREIFMECLRTAPAGPQSTKYNDWDEVVEACGSEAYYIALQLEPKIEK